MVRCWQFRIVAFLIVLNVLMANSQGQEKPEHQRLGRGDLATSLEIFNLWGEQPLEKQEVIKAAYAFLQTRPKGTIAELVGQPDFQRACQKAGLTHLGGPMLGCVSSDGVSIWMRTLGPAQVTVEVSLQGEVRRFGPVASTAQSDFTVVVPVTGLPPGGVFPYRVLVNGEPVPIPQNAVIRTIPANPEKVRIAFGSCMHRWGVGNPELSRQIRERQPAALLLIGDTAAQDRDNHLGLHRLDYLVRDLTPAWQQLVAEIPVYVTWDDHDYFNNDKWGIPKGFSEEDRLGVWEVFRQCWNKPAVWLGAWAGWCVPQYADWAVRYHHDGQPLLPAKG